MGDFFNDDSVFMRLIFRLTDIVALNILFIITCLPVFTIGTAITSMTYTAMKAIDLDDGYITKKYFKAFRQNFKQSTFTWLIMLAAGGVLFFDVYFWVNMWITQRAALAKYMIVFSVIMAFVFVMVLVWIFPIIATFQNKTSKNIWNALALSIRHFPWTLLLCITAAAIPVLAYFSFYFLIFMVVIGFGALAYSYAFLFKHIFKQYIGETAAPANSTGDADIDEEQNDGDGAVSEEENSSGETDEVQDSDAVSEEKDMFDDTISEETGSIIKKGHMVKYMNAYEGEDEDET